jgi:hypothetical protein
MIKMKGGLGEKVTGSRPWFIEMHLRAAAALVHERDEDS